MIRNSWVDEELLIPLLQKYASREKKILCRCDMCGFLFVTSTYHKRTDVCIECKNRLIDTNKHKECAICGKKFKPTNHKQKYCTPVCVNKALYKKYKARLSR